MEPFDSITSMGIGGFRYRSSERIEDISLPLNNFYRP